MSRLRNPFVMRNSEKIESSIEFVKLFDFTILDALFQKHSEGLLWENLVFIHSSPGGGKSSLLRVFEPLSLRVLKNQRSNYKTLGSKLENLGVLSGEKINLLAVPKQCTRNYELLEEMEIPIGLQKRYFFSLFNARITISTLKSISQLINISFPNELDKIAYSVFGDVSYFNGNTPSNGKELFDWASSIEKKVYNALDSFDPINEGIPGHDGLFIFSVLQPENFLFEGKSIFERTLFMFDDTHKLTTTQRKLLETYIREKRGNFSVWISERLEALDKKENLGTTPGRDYIEINLENHWRDKPKDFKKSVLNIANSRAGLSTEGVNAFDDYLQSELDEEFYKLNFLEVTESVSERLNKLTAHTSKYDEWLSYIKRKKNELGTMEHAILSRKAEIIINRLIYKDQLSLDFPLSEEELIRKIESAEVVPAAKLFISDEVKIPYYHGINTIVEISSHNVEQFLNFSSDLYEEMISNKIANREVSLTPDRQEKIIKEVVQKKWDDLSRQIPYGKDVVKFLSSFGEFAKLQTYKKNAPYGAGINGFTIKDINAPKLFIENSRWYDNEIYEPLTNVISTCISYNLLEIRKTKQGEKDKEWVVYYLNRWLCVKFGLPLTYGGFRHKNADELTKWVLK